MIFFNLKSNYTESIDALIIRSQDGKIVYKRDSNFHEKINLNQLKNGLYFVSV